MCEICHKREATAAAVLSFGKGPNIKLTNICQPCLDAHTAKTPGSLQEMLDQMEKEAGEEAQPDDEERARAVEHIAALCKERGLDKIRGAYSRLVMPRYEKADLRAAPLLWLLGGSKMFKGINSNQRDEAGRIVLPATEAKATIKIASIFPEPWIVVSMATRGLLESGGLVGLAFEEVAIRGHSIHTATEPFWELTSMLALPKMANSVIHAQEWGHAPYTIQDLCVEPHYRERELEPLGTFDIARTFERKHNGSQELIISQRFYQHCLKHKIPVRVKPVRIDSDCGGSQKFSENGITRP